MFWGLSDSSDLLDEYLNVYENQNENTEKINDEDSSRNLVKREINILIFGNNDPRHLIKTVAKMYTHKSPAGKLPIINFYLIDGCVEVVARNLLLLGIALENSDVLNLHSKVHLFMDVYGNSLLRASSNHYIMAKAKSLLKILTDDTCRQNLAPMLNFNGITYRERDGLENAFEFWLSVQPNIFQIKEYWNVRLRKELGTRFDYREGQFDWDLNMVLRERGGKQICSQEYRYWRETGIAFTFPEYEYSKPNKTLAAGLVRDGKYFKHRGYIGDMQTGPFSAFGLKCSDESLLASIHGENNYRATDITERNLMELFHELSSQTLYEHDARRGHKYGSARLKMSECLMHHESDFLSAKDYDKAWIFPNEISINFLSSNDIYAMQQQTVSKKWSKFFDVVFVSHNYFPFLQDTFVNILQEKYILILETKLLSTCRKEVVTKFEDQLLNYAKRNNLQNVINYNSINSKNFILKFKKFSELN